MFPQLNYEAITPKVVIVYVFGDGVGNSNIMFKNLSKFSSGIGKNIFWKGNFINRELKILDSILSIENGFFKFCHKVVNQIEVKVFEVN